MAYGERRAPPRPPIDQSVAPGVRMVSPRPASGSESGTLGGGWQTPMLFGTYSLWVDTTGDLRIKATAPTSDLDGTVVGTQS